MHVTAACQNPSPARRRWSRRQRARSGKRRRRPHSHSLDHMRQGRPGTWGMWVAHWSLPKTVNAGQSTWCFRSHALLSPAVPVSALNRRVACRLPDGRRRRRRSFSSFSAGFPREKIAGACLPRPASACRVRDGYRKGTVVAAAHGCRLRACMHVSCVLSHERKIHLSFGFGR